jgi:hypothetical protein
MPFPRRAHAVPLPCCAANVLDRVPFDLHSAAVIHIRYAAPMSRPCHAMTMSFCKRLLKATVQRGMGMACVYYHRPSRDGIRAT